MENILGQTFNICWIVLQWNYKINKIKYMFHKPSLYWWQILDLTNKAGSLSNLHVKRIHQNECSIGH